MFLGIDISKRSFDVALLGAADKPKHRKFANDAAGHEELLNWLEQHSTEPVHACLEATGTYATDVALILRDAGHRVSVVNPARVHAFAKADLKRAKTDKADALIIARFCQMHKPELWTPLSPEVQVLQGLIRRLEHLVEMKTMEENRLGSGGVCDPVAASLSEHIDYLGQQIEKTKQQIQHHIKSDSDLKNNDNLLQSIPGIGATTSALLLAELGDIKLFGNARQVAAYAGVVPRIRESGSSVRGRPCLSKMGSSRLRKALFYPAMVALQHNPLIKAFGNRLKSQGKNKMLILGAAMRKLLHLVFGVLKSQRPFDPTFSAQTA